MTDTQKLPEADVAAFVAGNPGWSHMERGLVRTFSFPDYPSGVAFAVRVGFEAEAKNHHPDILIGYRRVEVAWTTHDAGGITKLDTELAERTDELART